MSFGQSIKTCFGKYIDWKGRASRSEFWYFQLFLFILYFIAFQIDSVVLGTELGQTGPVYIICILGTMLPSLCAQIRRLHDVDRSGWWCLLPLTCIGIIPLLIWEASKGTSGSNQYGDDPLAE
tara:strand:+ start:60 stop:428 length:369 start_codon:yes stop_codon:yes gene_type:complete